MTEIAIRKVRKTANSIPDHILNDVKLREAISVLPQNYNFEIYKSVWKVLQEKAVLTALQFPEGLLMYACIISDIISTFGHTRTIILGDVTYGACCIDDFSASKLGATLLIHYGHSCLVPTNVTKLKVLYVFVEIQFDPSHLVESITSNFPPDTELYLAGTVQFIGMVHTAGTALKERFPKLHIPQAKPLSAGETLGCTSPLLSPQSSLVFVADGRFHLEAAMIQNPSVAAFRYDPYSKAMTREGYDSEAMKAVRWRAVEAARSCHTFGLVLGTLGRQGNPQLFDRLRSVLRQSGKRAVLFLMAELQPDKLRALPHIQAWVQVACPRLSIDWGAGFDKPLLTPFELEVALQDRPWPAAYPMDFYRSGGGPWTNYYQPEEALGPGGGKALLT